jgi:two-component system sensor histidine kinase UhpB
MTNATILIVEDEEGIAELITRYLKQAGYGVAGWVRSGEEALAQARRLQPQLALMDISLAGELDGVRTATRLREQFDIPVVFLTGLSDDETIERSHSAGAFGYIVKPFQQADLHSSIDLALAKHDVESRLRRIERWFGAAIRSIGDGVITTDAQGRVTFLNPVAETLTGWKSSDAEGRALAAVFKVAPEPGGELIALGANEESGPSLLTAQGGQKFPIEYSASPIRDDGGVTIGRVLVFRDITQRRRSEEEIRQSRERLRALVAHAESLREEERIRIAREVHDELGQMVTGLRMDLAWMERRLPELPDEGVRGSWSGKMRSMFDLLDLMVKGVRRISGELRPVVLDDLGLLPALEWQAREWQARTGIACRLTSTTSDTTVSAARATAVFRIFQEALTNVARHAQATQVEATLGLGPNSLTLEVRDNGKGITEEQQHQSKSFGLLGMKERAALLGGACSVHGAPGRGTSVVVKIPLSN